MSPDPEVSVQRHAGTRLTEAEARACLSALSMMLAGDLPEWMTGHQWNAAERAHSKLAAIVGGPVGGGR
jgi:hypothetical protein